MEIDNLEFKGKCYIGLEELPTRVRESFEAGKSIFLEELSEDEFLKYLEARDEHLLKEQLVRVGANGSTRIATVVTETSKEERTKRNFPMFKMKIGIRDIFGRT